MKTITLRTRITTKLTIRAAIALVVASAGAAWCLAATPSTDISSTGPLTDIWVGNDLSCQVQHVFDAPNYEFYPAGEGFNVKPGDYGTFIAMNGMVYAPDFANHDLSGAYSIGFYTPFTPISQTGVSGTGAAATPFNMVTTVGVAQTGLVVQQTDTYVVGDEFFTTQIMISNNGADTASGVLYRAFDAFLGGNDHGYGFTETLSNNRTAVACSVNPNNSPRGKIEELIPLTGGNNYIQENFDTIWSFISTQASFPNYCACSAFTDNGAGISWNFSIPAGQSAIVAHTTIISAPGLKTSKTADSPTSLVGRQNGYTITIENPNPNPVTVTSITDTLPAGFAYVAGSATNATTNDPTTTVGQMLTWSGLQLTVPGKTVDGNGSIQLHFLVNVGTTPGDYFNEAGGSADGYDVMGTGPTAKITVLDAVVTSKTADFPQSQAGTQNGYTITMQKPTANNATVTSITDKLPDGFSYVSGSTTGAASNDPAIVGQMLTWNGAFNLPSGGSITLHFNVTVSSTPGTYLNQASGTANYDVIDTGPTAPIKVIAAPPPTPTGTPTPCTLQPCTPTYPYISGNPQTNVAFNESTVMRGFRISTSGNGCVPVSIQAFYSDEHALTLGVRQIVNKVGKNTTTTNYDVAKLVTNPGSTTNPAVGASQANGGTDTAGRPMYPALFITDLSEGPGTTNALAGDWQFGGTGIPPTAVFGTWKAAVKTIDCSKNPCTTTVTPDADPAKSGAKNTWNLGPGADPVPTGLTTEDYDAEVRWDVNKLGLISGHQYRLYFMVHDGDQNKTGGDVGQACGFFTMP
jgi:uncharacterized repeat protein (TIGR01451 family)